MLLRIISTMCCFVCVLSSFRFVFMNILRLLANVLHRFTYTNNWKKNDILLSISALPVHFSFTSFLFAFRFIHNRICLPYLQCNFNTADTMSPNIPNPQSNGRSTDATKGPTNIPRRQCIPILYTRGTHYDIGFDVVNIHCKCSLIKHGQMIFDIFRWYMRVIVRLSDIHPHRFSIILLSGKPRFWFR